ncbi:MAG: hypothetical protein IKF59_01150 [Lachnospiraceae bacterium]|jgi:hypothetical protein|nr:hypothetical protein [Lachnospiraceae bacterium]
MAINPMQLVKLRSQLNDFRKRHPGFAAFVRAVRKKGVPENSVLEVKITRPDGEDMTTNFRVSAEDLDLIRMISELG